MSGYGFSGFGRRSILTDDFSRFVIYRDSVSGAPVAINVGAYPDNLDDMPGGIRHENVGDVPIAGSVGPIRDRALGGIVGDNACHTAWR